MGLINQAYTIKRAIELHGQDCVITRMSTDQYGDETTPEQVHACKGIFHAANQHLAIITADAGQTFDSKLPRFLILYTAAVKANDRLTVNGKSYAVVGVNNMGELNICLDLSLKEDE